MSFGLSGPEGIHPLLHARAPPLLVNNRYLTIIFCLWTLCEMDRAHPSAHCCRKCCFPLVELPSHMFCGKPVPVWSSDQKVWLKYKNFNPTPSLAVKKLLRTRVIATSKHHMVTYSTWVPVEKTVVQSSKSESVSWNSKSKNFHGGQRNATNQSSKKERQVIILEIYRAFKPI